MKKTSLFVLMAFILSSAVIDATAQKMNLNGKWKADVSKSSVISNNPFLVRIDVKISGDSLFTERYYDIGDGQTYPFTENLTLDGKEHDITVYDMPRKTTAIWSEDEGMLKLVSSMSTYGGSGPADFVSKETWKVAEDGKILTISFANTMNGSDSEGSFVMTRAE